MTATVTIAARWGGQTEPDECGFSGAQRLLLDAAASLLPLTYRDRYSDEWRAELTATSGIRGLGFAVRVLTPGARPSVGPWV